MRRALLPALCLALIACANDTERTEADPPPADTTAMAAPAAAPATGIAGRWNMQLDPIPTDSAPAAYVLEATDSDAGWTMTFTGGQPIPVRVISMGPDSVVTEAGPYQSVVRAGLTVTIRSVFRLQGDTLRGTTLARYQTSAADSVQTRTSVGTRAP